MYDRQALVALINQLALQHGQFRLASGKMANYYLDCRRVTLHSAGARCIAEGILDLMQAAMPEAVGGMAIGADPITGAVLAVAAQRDTQLRGFIVRKQAKEHGTGKDVEGPFRTGDRAVILEDVVTTGGSSLAAIDKAQAAGMRVQGVIAVVDRLEGAAETFAARGLNFQSLLTIRDLGIEPPNTND